MITYKDSIAIGSAIVTAMKAEITVTNNLLAETGKAEHYGSPRVVGHRATAATAMENVWYDVMPCKLRERFQYSIRNYMDACGWAD